jgi:DNA-binding PadR family transcriptional regulator
MFDDYHEYPHSIRRWLRHVAAAPKGFLRYYVLELLSEKPMSGSEIMDEVERITGGCWRPSPGSVYPLLAYLQDNGYIQEVPSGEVGVKRYTLTDKGKHLLEEQRKMREHIFASRRLFAPPFLGFFWPKAPSERVGEAYESFRRLAKALFSLGLTLEEHLSEDAVKAASDILNEAAQKIEDLERKLRSGEI